MTTHKKQPDKAITPVDTAIPVGKVIKAKAEKLKNNQILNCPKCNRAYKKQDSLDAHTKGCTGGKGNNGGAREGSGRKPGVVSPEKQKLKLQKELMIATIAARTNELLASQFRMALGQTQLFMREKVPMGELKRGQAPRGNEKWTFKVSKVHDEADFMIYLSLPHDARGHAKDKSTGVEYFYMQSKGGNYLALTNLLDRAYGKPKENIELGEDPEAPLPVHGTGTTTELRKALVSMVKQQIKDGK